MQVLLRHCFLPAVLLVFLEFFPHSLHVVSYSFVNVMPYVVKVTPHVVESWEYVTRAYSEHSSCPHARAHTMAAVPGYGRLRTAGVIIGRPIPLGGACARVAVHPEARAEARAVLPHAQWELALLLYNIQVTAPYVTYAAQQLCCSR